MDSLVVGLATIVGLFLTIGAPIIKLNSTITKAISRIDNIEERQKENKDILREMKAKSIMRFKQRKLLFLMPKICRLFILRLSYLRLNWVDNR